LGLLKEAQSYEDIESYLLETVKITGRLTPVYNLKAAGE